jgi:hypothetical protein
VTDITVPASESVSTTKGMSCADIRVEMAVFAQPGSRAPERDRRMGFSALTGQRQGRLGVEHDATRLLLPACARHAPKCNGAPGSVGASGELGLLLTSRSSSEVLRFPLAGVGNASNVRLPRLRPRWPSVRDPFVGSG